MATYGLSLDGFLSKPLTVIREELNDALRSTFGKSIDLGDKSAFGQLVGILAERYALLWELAEAIHSSQDADKASGAALEAVCTLTGTFRPPATYSLVPLVLTGTPGTPVPSGTKSSTQSTDKEFVTSTNATITALSAWAGTTTYAVGARATNAARAYQCTQAGTSASSGGPTTTDEVIADGAGTLVWTYLGEGTGAIDATGVAVESGVVTAVARDIKVPVDSVPGWSSVINLADAAPGRAIATDEELRLLREEEIAQAGTSTIDAISAALIRLSNVKSVTVFVNNTDTTNADGLPPHSVEALVRGPDVLPAGFSQTIFDALLANVAAGIQTHGTTPGTATDSQGTTHTVRYSQPTAVQIWVIVNINYENGVYPSDGAAQIKDAIIAFGDAQKTGKDVTVSSLIARAHSVAGVLEVTSCLIGTANPPTASTTIPIATRELATFDTTRIVVNATPATP